MKVQLSQEEQNLFVLELVKDCLEYGKDVNKSFEEVLNEDVFPEQADTEFAEMVCKTIDTLKNQGYISGNVELAYEIELDAETLDETTTDSIDFIECTFENIAITEKGSAYISGDNLKKNGKEFLEKVKPVIQCIATTALQTLVETGITIGLRTLGVPV